VQTVGLCVSAAGGRFINDPRCIPSLAAANQQNPSRPGGPAKRSCCSTGQQKHSSAARRNERPQSPRLGQREAIPAQLPVKRTPSTRVDPKATRLRRHLAISVVGGSPLFDGSAGSRQPERPRVEGVEALEGGQPNQCCASPDLAPAHPPPPESRGLPKLRWKSWVPPSISSRLQCQTGIWLVPNRLTARLRCHSNAAPPT
jgi:hypothetical protein